MVAKKLYYLLSMLIAGSILLTSCGDDDDDDNDDNDPNTLMAEAGEDQTVMSGQSVTIDGSGSTGQNISYEWDYSGPGDIEIDGSVFTSGGRVSSLATFTFNPSVNGIYTFNLRVTSGNEFSNDFVTVTVSGAIEITSFDGSTDDPTKNVFEDVELGEGPDYVINSVLTLPEGSSIDFRDGVVIEFGDEAGLILAGSNIIQSNNGITFFRASSTGWKGIQTMGTTTFPGTFYIEDAGTSSFEGKEAAAINIGGNVSFANVTFMNTTGYDIVISDGVESASYDGAAVFSSTTPIKSPFYLINDLPEFGQFPDGSVIELTSDPDVQLNTNETQFVLNVPAHISIPNGVHVNSSMQIVIRGDYSILMGENTSFISTGGLTINNASSRLTFEGIDGAAWNGIYLGGTVNFLRSMIVKNAGANPISNISITGITEKASIYVNRNLDSFTNITVSDGAGYGLFLSSFSFLGTPASQRYDDYTFTNNAMPAISVPVNFSDLMVQGDFSFSTPAGVAAIEVTTSSSVLNNGSTFTDLGADNFYHFLGNLLIGNGSASTSITMEAGVHMKFNTNNGITITNGGNVTATGTAENPIILEGNTTWAGVLVGGTLNASANCDFDYVTIQNGGSTTYAGVSNPAGVAIDTQGTVDFTNCTFQDNTGHGAFIDASSSTTFDFTAVENNNTFSGNSVGDVLDNTL